MVWNFLRRVNSDALRVTMEMSVDSKSVIRRPKKTDGVESVIKMTCERLEIHL